MATRSPTAVTRLTAAARRLAAVPNPAGLLYGALIAASVLATASAHDNSFEHIAIATTMVLVVYWLAHVYIEAQSLQLAGDKRHVLHRLRHTAARESSVIKGGLPAIVVFVGVDLLGLSPTDAAGVAVYFSVLVLVFVGYLTAHQAGRRGWPGVVDAAAAGFFGVLVILMKALLH
jgi:TRAP-type C4-dicarboxylate transport system permease large subunit